MQMDTLHCGYHHQVAQGPHSVGHGPLTPPATPTNDISRTPEYSSCEEHYVHHRYVSTDYHNTHFSTHDHYLHGGDPYTTAALSPPMSPHVTPISSPDHSPLHISTSMHPGHTIANTDGNCNYITKSSKTSTSSSIKGSSRNRKNSYVYDVRLPDEQFLFLVPDLDLVKSHLMFAVREEVEVLKEKITELMERINQLEYENTVLKQYATNDALQQIQQHHNSNT